MRERGVVPSRPDRRLGLHRGGGVAVRAGLPRLAAGHRRHPLGRRAGAAATATASPARRAGRGRAGRGGARGRGRLLDLSGVGVLRRAARRAGPRPRRPRCRRRAWPARSGRTGATASTSPARPTTPGTTRMEDRRDPMLTYAMTALAANKQARLAGQRATFGRLEVEPNGTNAVPSRVTAWLDARCESDEALADLVAAIERQGAERAGPRRHRAGGHAPSRCRARWPSTPELAARLSPGSGGWPVIPTQAGHDAGILSMAGIPTAMLFVRNPTGVSHSPAEHRRDRRLPGRGRGAGRHPHGAGASDHDDVPARARLGRRARRGGVVVDVEDGVITWVDARDRAAATRPAARPRPARPDHPRPGQLPQPRLPPRAARSHPARAAARSGPGATRCTPSPAGSTRTPTSSSPGRRTARWSPPGSPRWGSSTTSTTARTGRRTTTPTRWVTRCSRRRARPGIRITLLDTLYLSSGFGRPPQGVQPATATAAPRPGRSGSTPSTPAPAHRVGAALHSVRAVPRDALRHGRARTHARPLHVHLSEQVAENEACLAAYGVTPTRAARRPRRCSARRPPPCTPPT